jgi:uncharacterized Fe-S cluster-containing radical SAM superfamily protein
MGLCAMFYSDEKYNVVFSLFQKKSLSVLHIQQHILYMYILLGIKREEKRIKKKLGEYQKLPFKVGKVCCTKKEFTELY